MIELDGATGEGGGQILRTALTLSMITGQPFRITNIRANRSKPGLMRQHLVAVQAAAEVSGATVTHAQVGSTELSFVPGPVRAGDYEFAIGTAGSCTLVLQTLMLALLHANGPSTVRLSGGTHNAMAPPVQFLQRTYVPLLAAMGAEVTIELLRHGFYPAGGGCVIASIKPCVRWRRLELTAPGRLLSGNAHAFFAGIPASVGLRELATVASAMGWEEGQLHMCQLPREEGPGNALLITLESEAVTEVFASFGAKGISAEAVARQATSEALTYLRSGAAVGEHLADQLMLPMALAGGGRFTASTVSSHATTNAGVIARFLPVAVSFVAGEGAHTCVIESTCQAE